MSESSLIFRALLMLGCAVGVWFDIRERRLPNWLCGVLVVGGLIAAFVTGGTNGLFLHALHMILALMAGAGLFALGMIGGGDAKFYAAIAAWFDLNRVWALALTIVISGSLMAIGWLTTRRLVGKPVRASANASPEHKLPYGVAIALGAAALIWL